MYLTHLPKQIEVNGTIFERNGMTGMEAKKAGLKFRTVKVLSSNLRKSLDLRGNPYRPTIWYFVEKK